MASSVCLVALVILLFDFLIFSFYDVLYSLIVCFSNFKFLQYRFYGNF